MKLVDQSHEIIKLSDNVLKNIEISGRTCYKSEKKITDKSSAKFVSKLIKNGHDAMLEFGDITVKFITNRGVTHELVRHRLFSFAQESTRYVRYREDIEFIIPVWWSLCNFGQKKAWKISMREVELNYFSLLTQGWKPEEARDVLPNALKTEIIVKGNIREWRHMLKLRTSLKAHPQMMSLMYGLLTNLKKQVPVLFDDI
jgi:thymidylate synthase (FAD)